MHKFALAFGILMMFAIPALSEDFHNVPVVDKNCSSKVAADPDSHSRECALKCAASGYGIITKDQKFLKFDASGNAQIKDALQASDKKDHLRVDVSGDVENDMLKVKSVKLL